MEAKNKEQNYWRNKLQGDFEKSAFPAFLAESAPLRRQMGECGFSITGAAHDRLSALANNSHHRLHMILTAALLITLYKYSGQRDVIVGTTIDRQNVEGEFINTVLPLRHSLGGGMSFKELLLSVRTTLMEAVEHRNYPLEVLLYDLNMYYSPEEFPLFDVAVLLENIHDPSYLGDLPLNMVFLFNDAGQSVEGRIQFNMAMYDNAFVERVIQHFQAILEAGVANYDTCVADLDPLSESERTQLSETFNQYRMDVPPHLTLEGMFEEQVKKTPENIALDFLGQSLTYRQLDTRANQLAAVMRRNGVEAGGIVGLMAEISIEMVVGMIAILKTGAAFLPIEPSYPLDRIQYIVADSCPALILSQGWDGELPDFGVNILDLEDEALYSGPGDPLAKVHAPEDLAYIIYTSGSTGKPKGVMIEHRSIVNQIYGFDQMLYQDCMLNHVLMAPFTFDPSVQHVFSPLAYGAALYLLPREIKDDPERLAVALREKKIGMFDAVPSQIDVLIETVKDLEGIDLKYILLAGEVFSRNLYFKIRDNLKVDTVFNVYGPTEASINTTMYKCVDKELEELYQTVPIGKPLMNYNVFLLDADQSLLPIGVPGEMSIGGDGVARGYVNNPELTHQSFVPNPFIPGGRLYNTGDFVRWLPDGNLDFIGRLDHQVKIRGQRIELEEIEMRLSRFPGIKEAAVIAKEDKNKIKFLSAFLVTSNKVEVADIREYLIQNLPDYMVPGQYIEFERMPLTPNGKVDRKKLGQMTTGVKIETQYVPPRDDLDQQLAEIWREELELEKVGIKDNYFNIGGDSIRSIRLVNVMNEKMDYGLKIVDLYTYSTIEELSDYIKTNGGGDGAGGEQYDAALKEIEDLKNKVLGQ
jgi:amino acid adenylation domain-containing protein